MKTYKHLYPQITDLPNLFLAFKRAARGKRKKEAAAAFEYDLEQNLVILQQELLDESYAPGEYSSFRIRDPKPRLISAAPFRDRVVHHALCQVLEPIWERRFVHDTYACRVGRGTHAALDRATAYAQRFPYVLKCDIEQFFPSIDHDLLAGQFERLITDPPTLRLCRKILASGAGIHRSEVEPLYFPGDDLLTATRPRGLPIGNLTSQFWANVYLNPLDHFIKRELGCRGYVRYADDMLFFDDDKRLLWDWRRQIIQFLASLRLALHEEQAVVFPVGTGIPFLGWHVYPDHRRLKRRNALAFQRRFARMRAAYSERRIKYEQMTASVQSWVAHVAHGNTWGLRRALLTAHPI